MTSTQSTRWRPSRAGILNVYQYEDETLHFADGRLLLSGVNGSGKSTAMNMLLPFLLEADTRKIDAAGEQTGVLRSWMLADTEETQPPQRACGGELTARLRPAPGKRARGAQPRCHNALRRQPD